MRGDFPPEKTAPDFLLLLPVDPPPPAVVVVVVGVVLVVAAEVLDDRPTPSVASFEGGADDGFGATKNAGSRDILDFAEPHRNGAFCITGDFGDVGDFSLGAATAAAVEFDDDGGEVCDVDDSRRDCD